MWESLFMAVQHVRRACCTAREDLAVTFPKVRTQGGSLMAARTPDKIFDSIVTKQGKGAKVYRKLAVNKERNWLLALTLNTFAKLGQTTQDVPLTDVEQLIVDAYRKQGFSDAALIQHGRFYEQLSSSTRATFFPGTFAQLTPRTPYALRNLRQDAPGSVQ